MILLEGLDDTIGSFAGLVGLILTLITLFTGARDASVRSLETGILGAGGRAHLETERRLCWGLFVVTALLVVAGAPLWARTCAHWSWSSDHSIRWIFAIVWPLLVPLAIWQLQIGRRAHRRATEP
jgi:hypothetical protein